MEKHVSTTRIMSDDDVAKREELLKELHQLGFTISTRITTSGQLSAFCQPKNIPYEESHTVRRFWRKPVVEVRTVQQTGKAMHVMGQPPIWLAISGKMIGRYALCEDKSETLHVIDLSILHISVLEQLMTQVLQIDRLLSSDS